MLENGKVGISFIVLFDLYIIGEDQRQSKLIRYAVLLWYIYKPNIENYVKRQDSYEPDKKCPKSCIIWPLH